MTERVQFIVKSLNDHPLKMNLRLIDFHEKTKQELLRILIEVFVSIDPKLNSDPKYFFGNERSGIHDILSFLQIIRYKDMPSMHLQEEIQLWTNSLCDGNRDVIYCILEFCLGNYEKVKKRVYLAPFLTPIQLPLDLKMTQNDDNLNTISDDYQSLQEEFKHTHMIYETMKKNDTELGRGNSLIQEIENLKQEKLQLLAQIKNLDGKSKDDSVFLRLLKATTTLRREEEHQLNLNDQIKDQMHALNKCNTKLKYVQRHCTSLQTMVSSDCGHSPDFILKEIQKQLSETTMIVRSDLVSQRFELKQQIDKIEEFGNKIIHTEEDLDTITEAIQQLEEEFNSKKQILKTRKSTQSSGKISIFQQHVDAAKRKVEEKEIEIRKKLDQLRAIQQQSQGAYTGGTIKTPGSLSKRGTQQQVIINLQDDILLLQKTADLLKSRRDKIEKNIMDHEEHVNAKGFYNASKVLRDTVDNVTKIDEMKGQTLQEISDMVTIITERLRVNRGRLQPIVDKLKETRQEYQSIEDIYHSSKKRYDKWSLRLATDRQQLEKECDVLQEEWKEEERNYHFLSNSNEVIKADLYKVQRENEWRHGGEKMFPDFKSLEDLYQNKIAQQETLVKQLRVDLKKLNETEYEHVKQRQLFTTLKRVMDLKMKLKLEGSITSNSDSFVGDNITAVEAISV